MFKNDHKGLYSRYNNVNIDIDINISPDEGNVGLKYKLNNWVNFSLPFILTSINV